jgi:hypothetical protein
MFFSLLSYILGYKYKKFIFNIWYDTVYSLIAKDEET